MSGVWIPRFCYEQTSSSAVHVHSTFTAATSALALWQHIAWEQGDGACNVWVRPRIDLTKTGGRVLGRTFFMDPLSLVLVSMAMTPQRRSYTICQKSPMVDSSGPCTHAHHPEVLGKSPPAFPWPHKERCPMTPHESELNSSQRPEWQASSIPMAINYIAGQAAIPTVALEVQFT